MKSQYLPRFEWKSDSQSFIVYLIFTAPYFTLMTFNSKRFMYTTYYFAKFKLTWYWQFFFFFFHFYFQCFSWINIFLLWCFRNYNDFGLGLNSVKTLLLTEVSFMPSESYVKCSLLEKTVFSLRKKHWLLHSLISFSYTKSVTW